jgi:phospholipid/cholesterol/gamma-HCH transport system permease protein
MAHTIGASLFGARRAARPLSGATLVSLVEWFGEMGLFCLQLLRGMFVPPFEAAEFVHQLDELGAKSLPIAALAGAATGVVLALETQETLVRFGARTLLPALLIVSLLKESGPIITALLVSGRVAAGIGAELGAMKVSEQIDAMEVSAVDPFHFLVATRVLACVVMLPLLTLVADFCGIAAGWITCTLTQSISLQLFLDNGMKYATFPDFLPPTLKTVAFGWIMSVVACFQGMRASGGTEGVERAATTSVVLSSVFIIVADVLLVRLIQVVYP